MLCHINWYIERQNKHQFYVVHSLKDYSVFFPLFVSIFEEYLRWLRPVNDRTDVIWSFEILQMDETTSCERKEYLRFWCHLCGTRLYKREGLSWRFLTWFYIPGIYIYLTSYAHIQTCMVEPIDRSVTHRNALFN